MEAGNEAGVVGYQEEIGSVNPWPNAVHTVVLAEGWPSWAFALDGLGCNGITTYARFTDAKAREEFKVTALGKTRVSLDHLKRDWRSRKEPPWVFVQGGLLFRREMLDMMEGLGIGGLVEIGKAGEDRSKHWGWEQEISHRQVGGVTTGKWFAGATASLGKRIHFSKLRRVVRHILNSTNPGKLLTSTSLAIAAKAGAILPLERAPAGLPRVKVHAPNCITNSMVERQLSEVEMMDLYDVDLVTQRSLRKFWASQDTRPSFAFVHVPPIKVLQSVASHTLSMGSENVPSRPKRERDESTLPLPQPLGSQYEKIAKVGSSSEGNGRRTATAAKNDDAEVPVEDWDCWSVDSYVDPCNCPPLICVKGSYSVQTHGRLFEGLRTLLQRRWCVNVIRSFLRYMRREHGALGTVNQQVVVPDRGGERKVTLAIAGWTQACRTKTRKRKSLDTTDSKNQKSLFRDLKVGRDAIERAARSSWWAWDDGSAPFFWRWHKQYCYLLRDGSPMFIRKQFLPHYFKRQIWPKDAVELAKCKKKIQTVRERRYIVPGRVKSWTGFFAVPKGEGDIRMVYDATKCGLNAALWNPSFGLPTIDSVLGNADASTWFGDIDLGEMFLNYFLDEDVRPYAGLDLRAEIGDAERYERWERALMGLRLSPFICTQSFAWCEEIVLGDHRCLDNPFRWDQVVLNLPGSESYEPKLPWVYKFDSLEQRLASFFVTYIDDIRTGGASESLAWAASRRVASVVQYLGLQDAPRKRRAPSRTPGAWAGAMCSTDDMGNVLVTCSKEKWVKAKNIIERWHESVVVKQETSLNYKELESGVGFLVHLSSTFPMIFPYLKGIYHTLNSWRVGRDIDGWKYSMSEWKELLAMEDARSEDIHIARKEFTLRQQPGKPAFVKVVRRLPTDLTCLKRLFGPDEPPHRLVRGTLIHSALYGFGDASGGGFGSSWEVEGKVKWRLGTWGSEDSENSSSNLRELKNLVETLEVMGVEGDLTGMECFLFTDNTTAEDAFYNGSSSSKALHELVLRVKLLEMRHQCRVHLSWVSGTRMIEQGTDGLSRGNFSEGALKGSSMLSYIPIHLDALERATTLKPWLQSWIGEAAEFLSPEGWFRRGHDLTEEEFEVNCDGWRIPFKRPGHLVWTPAPAAGKVAMEELRKGRHKGQASKHLVVIPRLFQPHWRKLLVKAADLVISLPAGHPAWPAEMHEPLTLGFCLPYISQDPWELRRSPYLLELGSRLSKVWASGEGSEGPLLRELWGLSERLEALSPSLARKMLFGKPGAGLSDCATGKRRGDGLEEEERRGKIPKRS